MKIVVEAKPDGMVIDVKEGIGTACLASVNALTDHLGVKPVKIEMKPEAEIVVEEPQQLIQQGG